jgi:soluble lytic murein transglycosylase-like protein
LDGRRWAPWLLLAGLLGGCTAAQGADAPIPSASAWANDTHAPDPNDPDTLAHSVRTHAKAAAVDPVLVMAILWNESYKPHDAGTQKLWLAMNPGASLGVANMHRAAYEDTARGRDFAKRPWEDLADDPDLAVEAEAWYLHDLAKQLPSTPKGDLTKNELLALGYNTGPGNMRAFARGLAPGPMASTYLSELRDNWAKSTASVG